MNNVRLAKVNDLAQSFVHQRLNNACTRVRKLRGKLLNDKFESVKKKAQTHAATLKQNGIDVEKLEAKHLIVNNKRREKQRKEIEDLQAKHRAADQAAHEIQHRELDKLAKVRDKVEALLTKMGVTLEYTGHLWGAEAEIRQFKINNENACITSKFYNEEKAKIEDVPALKKAVKSSVDLRDEYHKALMESWAITDADDFKAYVATMNRIKKDAIDILPEFDDDRTGLEV